MLVIGSVLIGRAEYDTCPFSEGATFCLIISTLIGSYCRWEAGGVDVSYSYFFLGNKLEICMQGGDWLGQGSFLPSQPVSEIVPAADRKVFIHVADSARLATVLATVAS